MASPTPLDASTTIAQTVTGTSDTFSGYTVPATGQNRCLCMFVSNGGGSNTYLTGVTWNSVSMTKSVSLAGSNVGGGMLFTLANPATGNHNLVFTYSSNPSFVYGLVFTLQDVNQSSIIDATGSVQTSAGATTINNSVTTGTNNSVVMGWILVRAGATSISSNVGTTLGSVADNAGFAIMQGSYIEKTTAGSQSMTFNWTNSKAVDMFITSVKYQAPSSNVNSGFFNFF